MKSIRSTSFLAALAAAAYLTACGSSGVPDILGGPGSSSNRGDNSRYDDRYTDVRGTVDRVDTASRRILVTRESDANYLRNGSEGRQVALYYDDRTTVSYQGQTFRPEDLENGDRIEANIDESGDRLVVQDIQVLYDSSSGDSRQGDSRGGYRDDSGYRDQQGYRTDDRRSDFLRGTVRYVDTRARTLEIEPSSNSGYSDRSSASGRSSDRVVVYYDSGTTVQYQGRSYQPSNLERGDVVEIDLSNSSSGGTLTAEQITVVESQNGR